MAGSVAELRLVVALLTGGSDKPYALGLAGALAREGVGIEFVGSDELDCPELHALPGLRFYNLRGGQREDVGFIAKTLRIAKYYWRLLGFAATVRARLLHVLWNNKFEVLDRTLLMAYYRLLGKRIVLTAHNVNAAARDGNDTWLNRASLRLQYRLCHHVFVHTDDMKRELVTDFGALSDRVSVVPFGLNDTIPTTSVTPLEARRRLGLSAQDRTLLFFGRIAPYKGLEHLVAAVVILAKAGEVVKLVIGGRVERGSDDYWRGIQHTIVREGIAHQVIQAIGFIPDEEVEQYFKAADAVALPYLRIFQSGVPFLAFSFGVPVIATDVGSLRDDVVLETGVLCRPGDAADLARAISVFFQSRLFRGGDLQRTRIRQYAAERHSWTAVGQRTKEVYRRLLAEPGSPPVGVRAQRGPGT